MDNWHAYWRSKTFPTLDFDFIPLRGFHVGFSLSLTALHEVPYHYRYPASTNVINTRQLIKKGLPMLSMRNQQFKSQA